MVVEEYHRRQENAQEANQKLSNLLHSILNSSRLIESYPI